ncbi:hypothetical protein AAVH_28062 [Aphelenchoides avenae]|nr:hypothetical protein AAVH_28062 [Aphelenchus avenae]
MRARFDAEWVHYLLRVGNGTDFPGNQGEIYLPDKIVTQNNLIDEIYGELFERQMNHHELTDFLFERAIIAPLNNTCDAYNSRIIDRLPGDAVEHASVDEVKSDTLEEGEFYSTEFVNTLNPSELPPHLLRMKPGVVIMLLRNLRVHDGLCNGTRLLVSKVGRRFLEVMHMTGSMKGRREFLPRITLESNDGSLPFKFTRHQYPVKPCYAFSVNKAQAMDS